MVRTLNTQEREFQKERLADLEEEFRGMPPNIHPQNPLTSYFRIF